MRFSKVGYYHNIKYCFPRQVKQRLTTHHLYTHLWGRKTKEEKALLSPCSPTNYSSVYVLHHCQHKALKHSFLWRSFFFLIKDNDGQWSGLMGWLRWDALSTRIDVFFFFTQEVISPDFWYVSFWCTAATFSITVTSPASDRWHSSSQEEPREHIHLRRSSSRTTSTDITPHPHLITSPSLAFFTCFPDFSTHLTVSHLPVSDETSLFLSVTHSLRSLHMEEKPPDNERASSLLTLSTPLLQRS